MSGPGIEHIPVNIYGGYRDRSSGDVYGKEMILDPSSCEFVVYTRFSEILNVDNGDPKITVPKEHSPMLELGFGPLVQMGVMLERSYEGNVT